MSYQKNFSFNNGIKSIGVRKVQSIIESFSKFYEKKIISIGCGTGEIEFYVSSLNFNVQWIGIDPNPTKFIKREKPLISVDYKNVDDFIRKNPDDVGNCVIFLNWLYQDDVDMDAIAKLNPIGILSIHEYIMNELENKKLGYDEKGEGLDTLYSSVAGSNLYSLFHFNIVNEVNVIPLLSKSSYEEIEHDMKKYSELAANASKLYENTVTLCRKGSRFCIAWINRKDIEAPTENHIGFYGKPLNDFEKSDFSFYGELMSMIKGSGIEHRKYIEEMITKKESIFGKNFYDIFPMGKIPSAKMRKSLLKNES